MKIVRAVQTSLACPAQWDAWDEEGNYYYLRFRHGYGSVTQYKSENWMDAPQVKPYKEWGPGDNIHNMNTEFIREVTAFEYGDEWLGHITLEKFTELAGFELAENLCFTGFGDHIRDELVQDGFTFLLDYTEDGNETS